MKFKLLGALGVAAVGVLGLGLTNTGAWFTDQETTTVTASSGKVGIDLRGPAGTPFSVSNLMPGVWSGPYNLEIYNEESTVPVKYRVTSEYSSGSTALFDELRVKVVHGDCGFPVGTPFDIEPEKKLSNLNFNSDLTRFGGQLPVNFTHCHELYFRLPGSADNTYQGLTTVFDIVVDATQLENPGFSE